MADLLASLETGMTRTGGATQRLRSQITRIDEYMATQRQIELAFSTATPATSSPALIHPLLRNEGSFRQKQQQQLQWQAQSPEIYQFTGNSDGMGDGMGEQVQFHLPPELLEDWPWPFDITQGFGNF